MNVCGFSGNVPWTSTRRETHFLHSGMIMILSVSSGNSREIWRIISSIRLTGMIPEKTLNWTRESPYENNRKTSLFRTFVSGMSYDTTTKLVFMIIPPSDTRTAGTFSVSAGMQQAAGPVHQSPWRRVGADRHIHMSHRASPEPQPHTTSSDPG